MAFTHNIPYGTRHYGIGYSAHTNTPQFVTSTLSSFESQSYTARAFHPTPSRSISTKSTKVESFDAQSKKFTSESFDGKTSNITLTNTSTRSEYQNFAGSEANGTLGGTTAGSSNGASFGQTTLGSTSYNSTRRMLSFSETATFNDGTNNGTTSGTSLHSSRSDRVGSNSYTAQSGITQSRKAGATGEDSDGEQTTASGETTNAFSTTFSGTVAAVTGRQKTSIDTTVLQYERLIIGSVTTSTSSSYSLLSSNLLSTYSDSYSFRTSKTTGGGVTDLTVENFIQETISYSNFTDNTFRVYTVSGGGFFVTGSDILPNGILINPSSESVVTDSRVFSNDFNSVVVSNHAGLSNTLTETRAFGAIATITVDSIIFTNSTDTKLSHRFSTINSTLDFGESVNTIKSFYTTTYQVGFQSIGTRTFRSRTETTTDSSAGKSTFIGSGSTYITSTITKPVFGDGSFDSFTFTQLVDTFLSNVTLTYNLGNSRTYLNLFDQVTQGSIVESLPRNTNTGFASSQPQVRNTIATIDKGLQGGIQNRTSTNISGNIRSSRSITIADQLISTTTSSSSHITVNSAISQSYTKSAGFPLDLDISLNRYMSFFPDEQYGSIFTQYESMPYHLSLQAGGRSIIQFTSTGKYSTGDTSSRTTKSFATGLKGLVEVGLGASFPNGTGLRILSTNGVNFFESKKVIHGGAKFTDAEGMYFYSGAMPPTSFYVFGSNNSSVISLNSTDIGREHNFGTITLPANSIAFAPNNSILLADNFFSGQTFDHSPKQ